MPALDPSLFASTASPTLAEPLRELITAAKMPSLGAGPRNAALAQALSAPAADVASLPPVALAGLWLLVGDLDASHELSQAINDRDGSFWHGIMHRREGDFWNSKYWMRRVGSHPVITELKSRFPNYKSPEYFVDLCESAVDKSNADHAELTAIQWAEWQLLFAHCLS